MKPDFVEKLGAFGCRKCTRIVSDCRLSGAPRPFLSFTNNQTIEIGFDMTDGRGIAEPPAWSVGKNKFLTHKPLGDLAKITADPTVLSNCRAERIDDEIGLFARCPNEPSGAIKARWIEFESISVLAVNAADDEIDFL